MTKAQLMEYAADHDIAVGSRMTKAEIINTIQEAGA
jgi:hypothetical protein